MVGTNFWVQDVCLRLLKEKQVLKATLLSPSQQVEFKANCVTWDFHCFGFKTGDSLKRLKGRKLDL